MEKRMLYKYWHDFQTEGLLSAEVPASLQSSWLRCRTQGLDPWEELPGDHVEPEELEERIKKNQRLLELAQPILREAVRLAEVDNFAMSLLDPEGVILGTAMSSQAKQVPLIQTNNTKGFRCDEAHIGTTAVSFCLDTGKPARVRGPEHYCRCYHEMACSAAPIRNAAGELLAILRVSELLEDESQCAISIVSIAARTLEISLRMQEAQVQYERQNRIQSMIVESMSDGMLTVDSKGFVTFMNRMGGKILGVDSQTSIGKHISELVDFNPVILGVLETGKGYVDKEFRLEGKKQTLHFIKSAIPLWDEQGQLIGAVDVFREIKRVRNMVNRMTGAQAVFTMGDLIGESTGMHKVKRLARLAASSDSTVLIAGESGTGKEVLAQAIHNWSARKEGAFVAINCGAIPRDLIESELFGYEEGAFTGARHGGRPGKFEMAHGGTLFLDEIGDMPYDMQVKLLRVLQQRKLVRVGGSQVIPIDVRIIAATNRNLWQMVQEKAFREDLYYRINVMDIHLPPLREREGDLELLLQYLLEKMSLPQGKEKKLLPEAKALLCSWRWPGNIRELANAVEHAFWMSGEEDIGPEHLPRLLQQQMDCKAAPGGILSLRETERRAIIAALLWAEGNVSKAARQLGIGRNTLYAKMREYNLDAQGQEQLNCAELEHC